MRILVTGGAGYIGAVLTPALLDAGHRVTVLDTLRHGENSLAAVCGHPHFDVVCGDAADTFILKTLVEKHDILIPLAALVGAPLCATSKDEAWRVNHVAVNTLCSYASREQRVIFPTTNSGYGIGGEAECDENSPLKPISTYGITKVRAEETVLARENSVSLRLATVFGASPRHRCDLLVNDFAHRACTDRAVVLFEAKARRNFVHVKDVTRAFLHVIENFETMKGKPYNCGDSWANITKLQLCEKIKEHIPDFVWFEGAGEDPDKRDYLVSNKRMEATGWQPSYTLDQGIAELIKLYTCLRTARYSNV